MEKDDIKKIVKDEKVKLVWLQFVDIFGFTKKVEIPVSQLDKALNGEIMFDGSSIEGFVRIQESDMYLKPDFNSFCILPWTEEKNKTARIICDVYEDEETPFEGCPRYILKKTIKEAESLGFTMNAGPEEEFFLFKLSDKGEPSTELVNLGSYFDFIPEDESEDTREDIALTLEKMNFEIEALHHEVAPSQQEIDFKYSEVLDTADKVVTFRLVAKTIALKHRLYATFMPKPIFGINGSGMHTHISLSSGGVNIFYNPEEKYELSQIALNFIGGLLHHAKGFAAITNPIVNSYKRLVEGYEAPVYITWALKNRSALIRIPASRGEATRIELRNPDPTANPYLAFACILASGLDGVKNKITPGEPSFDNIYDLSPEEKENLEIRALPGTLKEAIEELKKDEVIKKTLGNHISEKYIEAKLKEWEEYRTQVQKWEIDKFLFNY